MFHGTKAFPESIAFPPALIWGFALFLALKEPIQSDIIIVAALVGEANFYCNFLLLMDALQVTWQKRNVTSFRNMASYSPIHGLRLIGSFQKEVSFTRATPKASAITLQNLTLEDDSYYRCIFNVFCHGSLSKEIRLNIQSFPLTLSLFLALSLGLTYSEGTSPHYPPRGDFQCSSISLVDSVQIVIPEFLPNHLFDWTAYDRNINQLTLQKL